MTQKKAVCLFSGGLDSTTVLYEALRQKYDVYALTIDYGQRHKKEIQIAKGLAKKLKITHRIVKIGFPWGGSALTDKNILVPKKKNSKIGSQIPVTYVPARNTIFLSFAFSWAEVIKAEAVFIGANQLDYSGYPDCRGPFLKAFEKMIEKGTKVGTEGKSARIRAPLLKMSKKQIVLRAEKLGVPYELTWSCYSGGKMPCGKCEACHLRQKGFQEAGLQDRVFKT